MIVVDDIPCSVFGLEDIPANIFKSTTRQVRRTKVNRIPEFCVRAMEGYTEAYKRVYHVVPRIEFDGVYFRIHGLGYGVKRRRLVEMTRQLEFRAG